jgi:AcrR family transcriptional regulator
MSDLSRARLSSTDGVAAGRRPGQRRRTRAAILAAAVTLLAAGGTPSMAEVAEAADVSRRTMYQYFPTLDQLLTEAALEAVRSAVGQAVEPTEHPEDVEARLDALVRATQRSTITNESLMRTMIRLTVERPPDTESESLPRRGYSRIEWIEVALQPLRKRLNKPRYERLVSALALCIGIEALLVLRDIRGLSASQAEDVSVWAAQSLLQAALEEMS